MNPNSWVSRFSGWTFAMPRWFLPITDGSIWVIATLLATSLRYIDTQTEAPWGAAAVFGLGLAAAHIGISLPLRLHQGRHRIGSKDEVVLLGLTVVLVTCLGTLALYATATRPVALSVPMGTGALAAVLILGSRLAVRSAREVAVRPGSGSRALIVGAGDAGTSLVRDLLTNSQSPFYPVALIDDDPHKQHYQVGPVPVVGTVADIPEVVAAAGIEHVLIAVPSVGSQLHRRVAAAVDDSGVKVQSLPALSDLMSDSVGFTDLRDLDIADLLGRHQVETDLSGVAHYLQGKRVLVTGAGGSIGSELCRQIARFGPARLGMLDRDESALLALQLSLTGSGLLDSPDLILNDIRDADALRRVMASFEPDVVFHAAALKHLAMLEKYPDEAWKSNVIGTWNVLQAAAAAGTGTFVNISTDKAADPSSVLGSSKRLAERLTAAADELFSGNHTSVRFGNVLGSRGSVVTTFSEQIRRGGPVTLTDPEVTRYFMTIPEAVQLVLQAGAMGGGGEAMVLDMGSPVRIMDLAHQLMSICGTKVDIVISGLRPGEKLHEVLSSDTEQLQPTEHPLISRVQVPPVDPATLIGSDGVDLREPAKTVLEHFPVQKRVTAEDW